MPRDVVVSIAALRRAYLQDTDQSVVAVAARFGISRRTLCAIAAARGWPRRNTRKLRADRVWPMWVAGVSCPDIGRVFGVTAVAVSSMARRAGWPPRGRSWRPRLTLAEWQQDQAARAMARVAAFERDRAHARDDARRSAVRAVAA